MHPAWLRCVQNVPKGHAPPASLGFAVEVLVGQVLPVFSLLGALPSECLDALDATPSSPTGHY